MMVDIGSDDKSAYCRSEPSGSARGAVSERNVTRAAARLGLGQPALSEALARLRVMLDDPLFVRAPGGMKPTARAIQLEPLLRQSLDGVRQILNEQKKFDPGTSSREFRVGSQDYFEVVILPALCCRLSQSAPGIKVRMTVVDEASAIEQMDRNAIDLAVLAFPERFPGRFRQEALLEERAVGIVRRDHPAITAGSFNLAEYASLPHVAQSVTGTVGGSHVADAMEAAGLSREVIATTTSFVTIPHLIAATDAVASLPRRLAEVLASGVSVQLCELPLTVPTWTISMYWNAASDHDRAAQWFRELVVDVCRGL